MRSLFSTSGLAVASARHPWRVLAGWLVALVIAGIAVSGLADVLTTEANFLNEPEAIKGDQLLEDRLRGERPVTETIVIRSETATVDDPAFRAVVEGATADLRAMDEVVTSAANYFETQAPQMVSEDRHATVIPVTMLGDFEDAEKNTDTYLEAIAAQQTEGFTIISVGDVTVNEAFNTISEEDLAAAEMIGLPIALLVLVVVFGALVAAGVPVLLALMSIFVSLGITALVGRMFELSFFVTNMITMIGLAVGIDYALFIIERYREERRKGIEKIEAIGIAGGTASKAVVFSGLTVVLALMGMFLIPTTIFRSLGAGAIIVVLVAVAASLTMVPAMLSLLGDKINWPRRRAEAAKKAATAEDVYSGFWGKITRVVMARPVIAVAIAVTLLVAAALPYFDLKTGSAGVESLPESEVRTGFEMLQRDFYVGMISPVEIVVDGQASDPAVAASIEDLLARLEANGQYGPATVTPNPAGDLTLVSAPLVTDANAPESYAAIAQLREQLIPASFSGADAEVFVTGQTAFNSDFNTLIDDYTPIVFIFVLGLSFVLLTLAFRSIVVPIKAIIMNLLSVGAAYGLLVLVFQKGYGADLLGFQQTATIESWLPIFLFCVLFGLSMDYHVFLLSRIREHYDGTGRNRESVAVGLHSTAKIITGAALIMVAVFAGFSMGKLVMMQQMGFGLAVAVFLDATIVRSVLVPATMALLGNVNWYLPRWLHWLPDLRVEGAPIHEPVVVPVIASGGDD